MRTKPTSTVCVIASPVVEDDASVADEAAESDVWENEASVVLLAKLSVSVWARASDAAAASSRILSIMVAVVIMHVLAKRTWVWVVRLRGRVWYKEDESI